MVKLYYIISSSVVATFLPRSLYYILAPPSLSSNSSTPILTRRAEGQRHGGERQSHSVVAKKIPGTSAFSSRFDPSVSNLSHRFLRSSARAGNVPHRPLLQVRTRSTSSTSLLHYSNSSLRFSARFSLVVAATSPPGTWKMSRQCTPCSTRRSRSTSRRSRVGT